MTAADRTSLVDLFWSKVNKAGPTHPTLGTSCWEWSGSHEGGGYANVWFGKRVRKAHRVSYELVVGPIPVGLELDHLCRNVGCVNPAHLEPVTHAENCRRGLAGKYQTRKMFCPSGHEYTPENTYVSKSNRRHCRACEAARRARPEYKARMSAYGYEWRAKRKAARFASTTVDGGSK